MEARILIAGQEALILRPGHAQWPLGESIVFAEAAPMLSCGMHDDGSRERVLAWLEHLGPEDRHRDVLREEAALAVRQQGADVEKLNVGHLLWAGWRRELSGAVEIVALDRKGNVMAPRSGESGYEPIKDETVGRLLERQAEGGNGREIGGRGHGLSGGRSKLALRWDEEQGVWEIPRGTALSSHIVKNESVRDWLPAEAAIESLCQRALGYAGVYVCETQARVYGGVAAVVSARSDRVIGTDGEVEGRVHQEEWSQAIGMEPGEKKTEGSEDEGWEGLLRYLGRYGAGEAQTEQAKLVRMIAGLALTGNGDAHRRNIGIQHIPGLEGRRVRMAPQYDCSSVEGTPVYGLKQMEIAIGGEVEFEEVAGKHWRRIASDGEVPIEIVMDAVREIAECLPEALERAHEYGKEHDETREEGARETRIAYIKEETGKRCARTLKELRTRAQRRRAMESGPVPRGLAAPGKEEQRDNLPKTHASEAARGAVVPTKEPASRTGTER